MRAFIPLGCSLLVSMPPVSAADILAAAYDPYGDELVVDIAYRGTNPNHSFSILWDQCKGKSPSRTTARLIDQQGNDEAREEYRVRERLSLKDLPCRPAVVTLRMGRVASQDVHIPAPPK